MKIPNDVSATLGDSKKHRDRSRRGDRSLRLPNSRDRSRSSSRASAVEEDRRNDSSEGGSRDSDNQQNFDYYYDTWGLDPSFLAKFNIFAPLHTKVRVENVSVICSTLRLYCFMLFHMYVAIVAKQMLKL